MKILNFRDCTLDTLDEALGMHQVRAHPILDDWLQCAYTPSPFENEYLTGLQKTLVLGVDSWNEVELENKFISPLIVFVDFDNEQFAYFLERDLQATIGDYTLLGRVDGMIASGFRNPRQPYFCLTEYKKQLDPTGDPAAQALAAMLAAQELNQHKHPVYGSYIVGRNWFFLVLVGNQYCISQNYSATKDELWDIFRILHGLKQMIFAQIRHQVS